jgi:hypothetical protein
MYSLIRTPTSSNREAGESGRIAVGSAMAGPYVANALTPSCRLNL